MKKLSIWLTLLLLVLFAAAPASANQPIVSYQEFDQQYLLAVCDYGEVWDTFHVFARITEFPEKDGSVQTFRADIDGADFVYLASESTVQIAYGEAHFQQDFTLVGTNPDLWQVKWTGVQYNLKTMAGRPFLQIAGQSVAYRIDNDPSTQWYVKSVGHNNYDEAAICAALAP